MSEKEDAGLVEGPGHAIETALCGETELVEGSWREVEVEHRAAFATVGDRDGGRLALVCPGLSVTE